MKNGCEVAAVRTKEATACALGLARQAFFLRAAYNYRQCDAQKSCDEATYTSAK